MKHSPILFLVEVAMFAALGAVLSLPFLTIPLWVQGGSIAFAMVPIFFMAYRWGLKGGVTTGLLVGIFNSLINPFIVHPVQYVMDYPLAYAVVGIAGIFSKPALKAVRDGHAKSFTVYIVMGTLLGSALRFMSHFIGGIVFFSSFAPEGTAVWYYSLTYNIGYMLPSFIISAVILNIILYKQPKLLRFGGSQTAKSV
ncbi:MULTISPECIES: energy-coupled thiamine transporter ThiT [Pontibacillus]|uniref:Energy-coupled thiamine transporter ThiT n=1 Tax=Pontibacillus chungwhensis TaxID=265426 RepID=A0ABY8V2G7_9BACI|nr:MULTISPECIES: energy-coupled thiamine transporter ThiT [Pontibacillus]MCD5322397.1 energy-coupled thiamine transporter ThiT [Pontibacillus sp. HN14]WIF99683.1 energy-coupled thiamine transporter ThiT [Pontibacillus chungwhensis]